MKKMNITTYPNSNSTLESVDALIVETDVVLDIGCGIVPMNYFRPKLHIMVEPWEEYSNILHARHQDDKSVLILKLGALEALSALPDKSVDSVFLLDVIEHLTKEVGFQTIAQIERVTRRQAVIFTPLGFMPQHMEQGEPDAWGLSGAEVQEHKSGWLPEDFNQDWEFHVCEAYHTVKFNGELLEKAFGAFFAIRNFPEVPHVISESISDIRKPLPSEIALQKALNDISTIRAENEALKNEQKLLSHELTTIKNNIIFRAANKVFRINT